MSWSLHVCDSTLARALLCALGIRDMSALPVRQQKGDGAVGRHFRGSNSSRGMPASSAPTRANTREREVLTETGWKFFSFKILNLIIHNPLASTQPGWLLGNAGLFQGWISPHSFSSLLVRLYFARSKGPWLSRLLSMYMVLKRMIKSPLHLLIS